MNILIPLGSGSVWQDNELRYALRGVEKHLKGFGEVVIVGEKPSWLTNVIHIPAEDRWQACYRDFNIYNKIRLAIDSYSLGEEFLFMNDDHFLLQDVEACLFPYHYQHSLHNSIKLRENNSQYKKVLTNTLNLLVSRNASIIDFDTHAPIIYNSKKFLQHVSSVDWSKPCGYGIKSLYCNLNNIEGIHYDDCKLIEPLLKEEILSTIAGRMYFSIGNRSLNDEMKAVLNDLYPEKSRFEL